MHGTDSTGVTTLLLSEGHMYGTVRSWRLKKRTLRQTDEDSMHRFLTNNRDELIERCKAKVAQRPRRGLHLRAVRSSGLPRGTPPVGVGLRVGVRRHAQLHQGVAHAQGGRMLCPQVAA